MTFRDFMEESLYGPDGYYSSGVAKTGRAGDYFTAPETGAAFGRLLAAIFLQWQTRLGTGPFSVIEAGAGEGRLARVIKEAMGAATPYAAIERSAARRAKISDAKTPIDVYSDLSEMPGEPRQGIIVANELIDAFPVHRVRVHGGQLQEMCVEGKQPGCYPIPSTLYSLPSTPRLAAYFDRLKVTLPEGYETEVNLAMHDWLAEASRALARGLIVLIDYGRPAWDYYAEERSGGTLRCFSGHRVIDPFASAPSGPPHDWRATSLDWTSDVDFTSLALDAKEAGLTPLAFMEMGTFLRLGIAGDTMVSIGQGRQLAPPTIPNYLLHPDGLGTQFHVLILGKNMDPTEWTFEHNRIARLGLPA